MEPNKDLGQHFMIDKILLNEIIEKAEINNEEVVLEIGSGEGVLSKKILEKKPKKLICIELDKRYKLNFEDVEFILGNALEKIEDLKFDNLVANIPYQISEPLIIKLLKLKTKKATIVCGKKFADALIGESIIGLVTRNIFDIKIEREINPDSFSPKPKVISALLTLRLKDNTNDIFAKFYTHQKQKVKNHLLMLCENKLTKKELKDKLVVLKHIENKELYTLNNEEYKELYEFININLIEEEK